MTLFEIFFGWLTNSVEDDANARAELDPDG